MKIHSIFSVACVALVLGGCISEQTMVKRYYTIEWFPVTRTVDSVTADPISASCEIEPVQISAVYDKNQIVNRSSTHEITYYKYHQWAVRPSVAIGEINRHYLLNSGVFESVSTRVSREVPDYLFETMIRQLEVREEEDGDDFISHLHLEFRLLDNDTQQVMLQHQADRQEPLEEKDLNLFAGSVSELYLSELRTFTGMILQNREELIPETDQ